MHEGPTENRLGELGSLYKYYYYYYERLGLLNYGLELFNSNWRKDSEKSKMERVINCFYISLII